MADGRRSTHLIGGQIHVRQVEGDDAALGELASCQHGVASRRQLLDLGISARCVDGRIEKGRLLPVFPGGPAAYAVGHAALSLPGLATAAVIAAGPAAAISHWTLASLQGLIKTPRPLVHLTCPDARRPRRGLFIHRAVLPAADLAIVDGIPATTVARMVLDLSAEREPRVLRTLIKRAEFNDLLTADEIAAILTRYPRRRGRGTLARIAAGYALNAGPTLSPLEDDFLEFCGARAIPIPETNVPLRAGGRTYVVDCLWRNARLVVELDGRDAHGRRLAFEDDRARDRALVASGWRPVRVTSAQLRAGADALEAALRAALGLTA